MQDFDLMINAREVISPADGLVGPASIGIRDGKIASVHPRSTGVTNTRANTSINVETGILLPGLVDLHAHPALDGSRFGIDPDKHLLPRGSTTVLSQGDAGARNIDDYIRHTIEASNTRIKLAINFCAAGESNPVGRFLSIDEADVTECVEAVRRGGSHIWGISLNIAFIQGRNIDPIEVLRRGIEAADQAECPVMFGATKSADIPLDEQLKWLRPGDVMTYCFHSGEGSIVENGQVLNCAWEARERGVLFDVGDGTAAFGFDTTEAAISEGFLPDTISSDFYRAHLDAGQEHDLPLVVSKLIAAGMAAEDCWPRITSSPADVLGLADQVGRIRIGMNADLCVLEAGDEPESLRDGHGQTRMGVRLRPVLTIKGGEIVEAS